MGKPMTRCVIVGAAPFTDAAYLKTFLRSDDHIIAADGGSRLLDAMGVLPHRVIGDFDSSSRPADTTHCTVLPTRKDDTDVLAAVRAALKEGYRDFLLLGCLGGRFDHTIANLFVLRFLAEHEASGLLVDEQTEVTLLTAGEYTLPSKAECVFSLLPYGGSVHGVCVKGAAYEVTNATFDTVFPIGVSNAFVGKTVRITLKDGCLLLILAKEM